MPLQESRVLGLVCVVVGSALSGLGSGIVVGPARQFHNAPCPFKEFGPPGPQPGMGATKTRTQQLSAFAGIGLYGLLAAQMLTTKYIALKSAHHVPLLLVQWTRHDYCYHFASGSFARQCKDRVLKPPMLQAMES